MKRLFLIASSLLIISLSVKAQKQIHHFALGDTAFLLDGKPLQLIAGEMHYPRIPKEAWRHRMRMAKAMGLNCIGTYVFWNAHEPEKGKYDFSGNNDVAAFIKIAQEEGLWVIMRPSPYVCAEWEFGGYPYWLQKEKGLVVRSKDPKFLSAYKNYIKEIGKQLAPLQVNHGGNVLMVQIENEYGFYGSDKEYLDINRKLFIEAGFDGLLFTCDPHTTVEKGYLPGLLPAINGLDKPDEVKKLVRKYHNGKGPYYISEWYPAWFDSWGIKHHTVPAEQYAPKLDSVLAAGISINMYMFHGGTTRDFMNGANGDPGLPYQPEVSSYDYDAPLDEAGNATHKFREFRKVIEKNLPVGTILPAIPAAKPSMIIKPFELKEVTNLLDILPAPVNNIKPLTFEDLNQAYGYVLYRTKIKKAARGLLKIKGLRDYGILWVNGIKQGELYRRFDKDSIIITVPEGGATIDLLIENLGRINFGVWLTDNKKGITDKVLFNGEELLNWEMYKLPFNTMPTKKAATKTEDSYKYSVIRNGVFTIDTVADTYLDMSAWGKGVVWVNGHNLGRYWEIGPQQTIYLPAEWLRKGKNNITVFEMLKPQQQLMEGVTKPILDKRKEQ